MGTSIRTLKAAAQSGSSAQQAATIGQGLKTQQFTATAGQTTFTLGWAPASLSELLILIDGTRVTSGYSFTLSGNVLTASPGLDLNMDLFVVGATGITARTDLSGAMTHPTLIGTGDGSTTTFNLPTAGDEEIVWLGGGALQIRDTDYTISTTGGVRKAVFGTAPATGVQIHASSAVNLLAGTDAQTLNNLPASAFLQTTDRSDAAPPANTGASPTQGTSTQLAREDHQHGAATELKTATTQVSIGSATAPVAGQVLTATSDSAATWQSPSAGGGVDLTNHFSYAISPNTGNVRLRVNPSRTKGFLINNQGTGIRIIRFDLTTMAQEASVDTAGASYMTPDAIAVTDTKIFLVKGVGTTQISVHRFDATTLAFDTTTTGATARFSSTWNKLNVHMDTDGGVNLYILGVLLSGNHYTDLYRFDTSNMTFATQLSDPIANSSSNAHQDVFWYDGAVWTLGWLGNNSLAQVVYRHNATTLAVTNTFSSYTSGQSASPMSFVGGVGRRLLWQRLQNGGAGSVPDILVIDTQNLTTSTTLLTYNTQAGLFRNMLRKTTDRYLPLPFQIFDSTNDTLVQDLVWNSLSGDNQGFAGSCWLTSETQIVGNFVYTLPNQSAYAGASTLRTTVQRIPFKVS